MKFFNTTQIRELDKFTIEHEPITSIDLMERAATALYKKFQKQFPISQSVCIFAGPGNNGGDALALARMLLNSGYVVEVVLLHTDNLSADCEINRQRLSKKYPAAITEHNNLFIAPEISSETIIIDGLFGSGLSRPLSGLYADAVKWINHAGCKIISIDIPSGLQGEENRITENSVIVKASLTFSLQFPKLAFLFPENATFVGNWEFIDIGIHPEAIHHTPSELYYLEETEIVQLLKKRSPFSHKGTFGHGLIVAGSKGMAGASVLAAKAALRSGAGLITIHGPSDNRTIVQTALPEAIYQADRAIDHISDVEKTENYNVIAVGPGIGTEPETADMLRKLLQHFHKPFVLDADALNILSQHNDFVQFIPQNSILTPHPKEFERLFGATSSSYERMLKAHQIAKVYEVIIILKGAHTLIASPEGKLYFNSTGNSGMSTAGSGDVLTGILTGLLAQGYSPEETAKIGVFLHGRAGDLALDNETVESLIAGDIVKFLGKAFKSIRK